jgi:uncharacterized membrane protein YfcA
MDETLVFIAALIGAAVASVAGFGIGSILTPLVASRVDMKLAVAVVSIPHVIGTAIRLWFLRAHLDRRVLLSFGVASAAGGLAGAVLHSWLGGRVLTVILAALLIFTGATGLFGITLRFGRRTSLAAGAFSGLLGGLVGNQGGVRTGAMIGFDVRKEAFVATSSAVALFVDGVRVPVYIATEGRALLQLWPVIAISVAGVIAGTFAGRALLGRIPEALFKRVVSGLILVLGIALLAFA